MSALGQKQKSALRNAVSALSPKSGLMQRSKQHLYSITSSARRQFLFWQASFAT
jgi:hypothetical protein